MSTITYIYQGTDPELTYTVDYSGESGKIVLENNPFQIENKKVEGYKTNPNNPSYDYYPLQLIDVPENNITLYTTVIDAGLVQVKNVGLPTKDISGMVLNVVQKKGKNQPFSYVVLTLSRQLFIDANVTMAQKLTKFKLNIYGITGEWIYERLEDNGSYYDITLVNRAYYLKNITLLSLLNFTVSGTPTASTNPITLTNLGMTSTITWDDKEGSFPITFDSKTLTVKIKRNTYTVDGADKTDYSLTKISNCNPDDLFYFLAKYVAGYTSEQMDISPGFYYNVSSLTTISDTYTTQDIENLKNGARITITNQSLLTSVSLRLDEFCWDILQSLAYLSNREIIFDDKAYFKPFTPTEDKLSIDWEPPTDPLDGVTYITTMALSENDDQGSQYLTASQKVVSEAYETTVAISDTTSSYVGNDIKFLAIDDTKTETTDTNNSKRNTQAKIVALNALIKNFKPGDCIEYSVNETTVPDVYSIHEGYLNFTSKYQYIGLYVDVFVFDKILVTSRNVNDEGLITLGQTIAYDKHEISDWNNFSQVANTDCFLFKTTLPGTNIIATETYYIKKNNIWYEYDTDNPLRETGYGVNACVLSITDAHNNITLSNVPLALKTIEYPACVTTYTWGNPQFMDEQSQFNDLTAISQDTVLDNTSDTGISSGDATKLVVGNQYVHQLRDDRKGFTGLIMEKNLDNNVYRLVGYDSGTIQAQFNSEGKIIAGENLVTLSDSGITIGASPTDSPTYISLNGDSSILITDDTTEPAVSVAAQGSFFKNDVTFSKSITVDEGITIGDQGSKLSSGSLAISLVDSDNQTQTFTSPTVVTSPAEGEAIAGTYSEHRFTTTFNNLTGGSSVTISPTITPSPSSSGESGNITWVANQNNIANILLGKSNGNVTFSYKTAKNPEKYPQINITNMNLKVNAETGNSTTPTITPNTLLRTYPVISSSPYQVPSTTIISIPISWEASTEGALNESLQVTVGYTTRTFSYLGSGNPMIGNKSAIKYVSSVISLTATQSAGSTYIDIKLPNTFTLSTSGALTGTFVYSIESIQFLVRLPLSRVLSFSSMRVGTLGMSSAGNMIVSKYGVWGSSTVVDTTTTPPVIKANSISPIVNTNYLEGYTNSVILKEKTTDYNVLGLKRIVAIPYGTQPPTLSYRSGDIILYYTT